jgi:hypothetical protein
VIKKSRKNGWFSTTDKTIALQNRDDSQYIYILDVTKKQYERRRTKKVLSNEFDDFYWIRVPTTIFERLIEGFTEIEASAPKLSIISKITKNMGAVVGSPITEAVIVAATAGALIYYTGNLDGVINAGTNVLGAMKGKAMDAFSAVKDAGSNALKSISGCLGEFFGKCATQNSGSNISGYSNIAGYLTDGTKKLHLLDQI